MDRVRPAMLIAARVVDVGRRLPRRCGSAVPPSARLIRVYRNHSPNRRSPFYFFIFLFFLSCDLQASYVPLDLVL